MTSATARPLIRNPAHFCAFTFFFPSLVAGPIKRYQPFLASLETGLASVAPADVGQGLLRVALGLFKKVVVADNLTEGVRYWHERYAPADPPRLRWEFLAAIGLRILFDFSGYSYDIADRARPARWPRDHAFPENFRWPYIATSVYGFLAPAGTSPSAPGCGTTSTSRSAAAASGLARKIANGFVAFALVGLWHGPAWNFAFWGVYHGAGLAVSSNYEAALGRPGRLAAGFFARFPVVGWAITLLFVLIGWLFFFYPVAEAGSMLKLLFISGR